VALNMFSAGVVTRTKGQSVIARAAYNARECLMDDRTGEKKDYRSKGGIEFQGIFTPKGAPKWMQDREALWNAVEEREDQSTRPDNAQLARDFKIALPHELNEQQRRYLITDFARELSRKGMVVDVTVHRPDVHSDERNYHAHLLATMREVTPEGFGGKVREWNKKEELQKMRERWSELGARALKRAGFDLESERFRVGHKTLKEQYREAVERGDNDYADYLKDRQPAPHLGPNVAAMKRDGKVTEKIRDHERVTAKNEARWVGNMKARDAHRTIADGVENIIERGRKVSRILGKTADIVADGIASLANTVLTPEQKLQAEISKIDRDIHEEMSRDR